MDFDLTEEQSLLQDSVTKLLAASYSFEQRKALRAASADTAGTCGGSSPISGCSPCPLPRPTAALGGGAVDVMLLMEAFGRHLVLEPYLATVVLAGGCLRHAATEAQRAEWLPGLICGRHDLCARARGA